jgi:hypothetical protein
LILGTGYSVFALVEFYLTTCCKELRVSGVPP